MTVSQPDGGGQSSSLALLIWMMITTTPQPLPSCRPGPGRAMPCVAAIVIAASCGRQRVDRTGLEEKGAVRATVKHRNGVR